MDAWRLLATETPKVKKFVFPAERNVGAFSAQSLAARTSVAVLINIREDRGLQPVKNADRHPGWPEAQEASLGSIIRFAFVYLSPFPNRLCAGTAVAIRSRCNKNIIPFNA